MSIAITEITLYWTETPDMSDVERLLTKLPGREKAKECCGEGVVWDPVTKRYTRVSLGPKGATAEERGIFIEGDFGLGNMPYTNMPAFRISGDLLERMLSETEKRHPTEQDIMRALSEQEDN